MLNPDDLIPPVAARPRSVRGRGQGKGPDAPATGLPAAAVRAPGQTGEAASTDTSAEYFAALGAYGTSKAPAGEMAPDAPEMRFPVPPGTSAHGEPFAARQPPSLEGARDNAPALAERESRSLPMSTAAAPLPVVRARSFGNNSHVDAARALQEASVESGRLRDAARAAFRQALRPEVSGIAPEALAQASARVRVEVEQLARGVITTLQDAHSREHKAPITDIMGQGLIQYLLDCQFGAGALEPLFAAGDVEDICVNTRPGADGDRRVEVFTFRAGGKKREEIDITVDEVIELANRHAASQGRSLNTASPVLSAQMASGARLNAVLDPVCDGGVSMTIRLHRLVARTLDDLVALGTLSVQAANYIHLMAHAGVSMVIAGGTGSGKTNLLNAVARSMPQDLRCVVIEDTRELQLEIADVVYLRTVESPDNRITQRQLVANALRMRPDRIVIGEVRDGAAWDAIKATNTGHAGTLLTIHAEDAHAVITRLMQLCAEAPETANMSEQRLVQTISSAFNTVVFIERTRDGSGRMHRAVKQITDMTGQVSDGQPQQIDLFRFQDGALRRTSARPHASTMRVFRQGGYSEQQVMDAMESETPIWMGHAAA